MNVPGGQQFPLRDLLGAGAPGRLIDVKPGEMQGRAGSEKPCEACFVVDFLVGGAGK